MMQQITVPYLKEHFKRDPEEFYLIRHQGSDMIFCLDDDMLVYTFSEITPTDTEGIFGYLETMSLQWDLDFEKGVFRRKLNGNLGTVEFNNLQEVVNFDRNSDG